MKHNISTLPDKCCGCSACKIVCPKNAISISINDDGFYSANVDEDKCVNCGLCCEVCLRNGVNDAGLITDGTVVAAQTKDKEVLKQCSSGGVAAEFTSYALNQHYRVAGCIYDYESEKAKIIVTDKFEDTLHMRGSKYLQSDCSNAYAEIVRDATQDKEQKFLVFGTPCQIYGLCSVIEKYKIRDQFVLVDLFCHGVPSYLVWKKYLFSLQKAIGKGHVHKVAFRDKRIGWHNFVMSIEGANGKYQENSEGDLFFKAFFDNVFFSKACYDCPVRRMYSKADIRLGDFWGKRYQDNEEGISAVLVLSQKGEEFLNSVQNLQKFGDAAVEEVLSGQSVHEYNEIELSSLALNDLKNGKSLKGTIMSYRKHFDIRRRVKLMIKESTSYLPDGIRATIRKVYKKI